MAQVSPPPRESTIFSPPLSCCDLDQMTRDSIVLYELGLIYAHMTNQPNLDICDWVMTNFNSNLKGKDEAHMELLLLDFTRVAMVTSGTTIPTNEELIAKSQCFRNVVPSYAMKTLQELLWLIAFEACEAAP